MSTFSLTRGSEAALGMLARQTGSETLLLTQPARELRAELSIEPFTSDSGDQLLAVLFMREQRHSMTLQRNDGANVQHLADWIVAVANGTLDTAEAIPQRADPSDLAAATAAFHAAAHELNAQAEPATAQDELAAFGAWYVTPEAFKAGDSNGWRGVAWAAWQTRASLCAELVDALEAMVRQYPNPDLSHVDYRGHACKQAEHALAKYRAALATSPAA
ncbi:hypothetical protein [Stutzerimonas balearica]|uniref:hypothetical protein n=1 Tax=Stutzerimonas balearica TaxID=74829 RepID=UPI00190DA7EE|nr:hypothetical protein [Stutzerimonas balearica]MBK3748729.1 hypothetical protein [Stutzerimonas balearica]MBK3826926.1 hypothetical protein [Stutzerimonas balearica]MBK3856616.1 hypothetical protein [Stutzerimonas balearica]